MKKLKKVRVLPKAKRARRSGIQGLLDLGALVPFPITMVLNLPSRLYPVTYINLDDQMCVEGEIQ